MSKVKFSRVSLPGPRNRETWVKSSLGSKKASSTGNRAVGCYCIPANELTSIPLWVNATEPDLIEQLVEMELDRRHLAHFGPGTYFDYRVVGKEGARSQVEITILPVEISIEDQDLHWGAYQSSAHAYPLLENQLTLWREEGKLVAAFSKGAKLAYCHPLGVGKFDGDLISELHCLFYTLAEKGLVSPLEGITVYAGSVDAGVPELLQSAFGVVVSSVEQPAPDFPQLANSKLEPTAVAELRITKANRKRSTTIAVAASLAYLGLLVLAVGHVRLMQAENEIKQEAINSLFPEATVVNAVRNRWEHLRPAVDPSHYPLDLFHRCASILPEKGVRITHFEVKGDRMVIRGEATNPALAIRYQNDLISLSDLSDYRWEARQPKINPIDNRAGFQAIGSYRYGQAQN